MSIPFKIGDTVQLEHTDLWNDRWHGPKVIKDIRDSQKTIRFDSLDWVHFSHFRLVKPGTLSKLADSGFTIPESHPAAQAPKKSYGNHMDVFHYDGAYKCLKCGKTWGALPGYPTMPEICVLLQEADPSGLPMSTPGAKADKGKVEASLLLDFGQALLSVAAVSTHGVAKYSRHGWLHVDDGERRYKDAMMRHILAQGVEDNDPDSGLSHAAHVAWNALAALELHLRTQTTKSPS